jgi:hypothetical protein
MHCSLIVGFQVGAFEKPGNSGFGGFKLQIQNLKFRRSEKTGEMLIFLVRNVSPFIFSPSRGWRRERGFSKASIGHWALGLWHYHLHKPGMSGKMDAAWISKSHQRIR